MYDDSINTYIRIIILLFIYFPLQRNCFTKILAKNKRNYLIFKDCKIYLLLKNCLFLPFLVTHIFQN